MNAVLDRPIKILLAKVGLDGHDRGIVTLSKALMDAGMEVIYMGAFRKVRDVVATAIQEDVDAIGLSFLGGEHLVFSQKTVQEMRSRDLHIPLLIGGVIPREDAPQLKHIGVSEVFITGVSLDDIKTKVKQIVLETVS